MKPARVYFLTAAAGIALGTAAVFSPGALFILFLAAGSVFGLYRFSRREDRRFLVGLFLAGLLLRASLSVTLDLGSILVEGKAPGRVGPVREWSLGIRDATRRYLRMGDSDYYSHRAFAFAQYMEGNREQVTVFRLNQYGWNGYVDLMGMFYYLFGFSPIAVKGLNCFLGAWMGVLLFLGLRRRFHPQIARWSAVAVACFPSLVFWSISNLKDTPLIFLTLLAILLFVRLDEVQENRDRLRYAAYLAAVLALHGLVREGLFLVLAASLLGAWILARIRVNRLALGGCVASAIGLGAWPAFREMFAIRVRSVLAQLFHKHIGYAVSDGMAYPFLPPEFYIGKYNTDWVQAGGHGVAIAIGIVKALLHFFAEPVLTRFDRPIHLLGLPQLVVWYGVLFFALIGVAACLRRDARKGLFLLLPALLLSFVIALTCGNVGTLFRVRDLVTPFILSFACAGLWVSFYGSEGLFFTGFGEAPRKRDAVRNSLLARQFFKIRNNLHDRTVPWKERAFRIWTGWLSGPFSRRLGLLLTLAVLVNSAGTLFLHQTWTLWNAGFRIGLLGLGLWGLRTSSDWKSLKEGSRIGVFHEPIDAS